MGSFFSNEPEDEWESDEWLNPSSRPEPKTRFDRAMAYFGDEHIRCKSDVDKKTVEQLYRVLKSRIPWPRPSEPWTPIFSISARPSSARISC